jgi:hypothetical protein
MSNAGDCPRIGKFLGGCSFEARYDKAPVDPKALVAMWTVPGPVLERFRKITYVHDICTSCGKIVKRSPPSA